MQALTPRQLQARLESRDASPLLLDIREPWEVELASLPGSMLTPMSRLHPGVIDALPTDRDIVVMCHHGIRSAQVTQWLERNGLDRVFNLTGGIDAWSRTVDPGVPLY